MGGVVIIDSTTRSRKGYYFTLTDFHMKIWTYLYYDMVKLTNLLIEESTVLIVGHEPYLSTLISEVISLTDETSSRIVLKKAGLVKMKITSYSSQIIHGELEWLLTPQLMKPH